MDINFKPYNEKQFLLGIYKFLSDKYGNERRYILEHKFSPTEQELVKLVPDLNSESENILIDKYINEWFKEAEVRGHVDVYRSQGYILNQLGLEKALNYKKPIKSFVKEHWKFLLPLSLTFITVIIGILRFTKSFT
jgi:hypothetical protein